MSEADDAWFVDGDVAPRPVPEGARCALHHETNAAETCTRCGTFLCGACIARPAPEVAAVVGIETHCISCASARVRTVGASWLSVAAVLCSFVGIGCVMFAPVGIGLAIVDLVLAGKRDGPRGRVLDVAALVLGAVGLIVGIWIFQTMMEMVNQPYPSTYEYDPYAQ